MAGKFKVPIDSSLYFDVSLCNRFHARTALNNPILLKNKVLNGMYIARNK